MKSIKEKAEEYRRVIKVIDEHESIVDTQGSEMFETGANYVLEIIEQALTPQKCLTDIGIDVSPEALIKTALQTIEQLKR